MVAKHRRKKPYRTRRERQEAKTAPTTATPANERKRKYAPRFRISRALSDAVWKLESELAALRRSMKAKDGAAELVRLYAHLSPSGKKQLITTARALSILQERDDRRKKRS